MARARTWLPATLALILAVVALRLAGLWFNATDLFVDEALYWVQSLKLEFGTYSKPPMITWVIRAVTGVTGCDSAFCIRLPGPVLHGLTALILAALAAREIGPRAALPVALAYLTLPFVSLGSLLFSTDTVMLPFFAGALYAYARLTDSGRLGWALATGLCIGLAMMAKYAGVYALAGIALAALVPGRTRIGLAAFGVIALACLAMLLPNILWNAANQFATVSHTMENIGWVAPESRGPQLNPAGALEFLAAQFGVFGPVMALALIATLAGRGRVEWKVLAILPLIVVTAQALLDKAYANWAVAAYVSGTLLAMGWLLARPRLWRLSLGLNIALALLLPALTLVPDLELQAGKPVLARYIGRADLSRQILALSAAEGHLPVVASNRDILADLYYTGRQGGTAIYAQPFAGFPRNYFEKDHSLPPGLAGPVLLVGEVPQDCQPLSPPKALDGTGVWAGREVLATRLDPACLFAAP